MFDMDGTLVSTLSMFQHCLNEISLKYKNESLGLEDIVPKFGPPVKVIVRDITATLPEDLQNRALSDFYDCWMKNARSKVIVFPGIPHTLQNIRSSGKHLGLVTGVEKIMMESTLKPFELNKFFETLISADDVQSVKPDPEGILLALDRLEASPRESIYIGDSPSDILAGKRAGVLTGAALWGGSQTRKDPVREHPDYKFNTLEELSDLLFEGKSAK